MFVREFEVKANRRELANLAAGIEEGGLFDVRVARRLNDRIDTSQRTANVAEQSGDRRVRSRKQTREPSGRCQRKHVYRAGPGGSGRACSRSDRRVATTRLA